MTTVSGRREGEGSWRGDPAVNSLRLLPSGPDRVGEQTVRHQLPRSISVVRVASASRAMPGQAMPGRSGWWPPVNRLEWAGAQLEPENLAESGAWMPHLVNPPPHVYAGADLDRAAKHRLDAAWLAARHADPTTRVLLMSKLELMVADPGEPPWPCCRRSPRSAARCRKTRCFWAPTAVAACSPPSSRSPRPAAATSSCAASAPPCRRAKRAFAPMPAASPSGTRATAIAGCAARRRKASRAATCGAAPPAMRSIFRAAIRR